MVQLKTIPRRNPQDLTAPARFYAHAVSAGEVHLESLAYLVSNQCTVRESDCYAALIALMHNVMDKLQQSRVVKMSILNLFQVDVNSTNQNTAEEVTSADVRSAHLNIRPGKRLRDMLTTLNYKLVDG